MGVCFSIGEGSSEESGGDRSSRRAKRKHRMEVLTVEAKNTELLYRTPGRMCANGASNNACIFTQQGRKGTNQDAMVVWENFASESDSTFSGVFDGHGPFGHLVARKVRDSLPSKLSSLWRAQSRSLKLPSYTAANKEGAAGLLQGLADHKLVATWKECFLKAYSAMDKELKTHPTIDCFCSGTTAVTMMLQGHDLIIGNVGDSRAVLATLDKDNVLEPIQLTVDLKPNLPLEAERIKRCKGRVFALEDEPEVARVWLPHDDSPGLAMARAFGDFCLKDFGLIAVPEVTHRRLSERDQFVVLASDGVWDVLSNKEVVDVIWTAPTRTTAARSLVETAVRAWRLKYPTSKVDDCAVVCLFLNKHERRPAMPMTPTASDINSATAAVATATVTATAATITSPSTTSTHAAAAAKELHAHLKAELLQGTMAAYKDALSAFEFERSNTVRSTAGGAAPLHERHVQVTAHGMSNTSAPSSRSSSSSASASSSPVELAPVMKPDLIHAFNVDELRSINADKHESALVPPTCSLDWRPRPTLVEELAPSEITLELEQGEEEGKGRASSWSSTMTLERSTSRRSLAECLSVAEEEEEAEWSALEGVVRVNSLLNLPRFLLPASLRSSASEASSSLKKILFHNQ